jgi:hypothetical protein
LNEPVICRFSSFKKMEFPVNCEKVSERMNGETKIELRMRFEASWIVLKVTIAPGPLLCSLKRFIFTPKNNKGRCPFWVTASGVSSWRFAAGRYPLLIMGIICAILAAETKDQ